MPTLYLDLETYSERPIADGAANYAADPSTEITLFVWAIDSGPVRVWDVTSYPKPPALLLTALQDPGRIVVAHNAWFDRTVFNTVCRGWWIPIERWHCTMAQALAHSLPGGLGDLCDILAVPQDQAKMKDSRQLVLLFCKPRPASSKIRRATAATHPAEWARFVEYARLDVEAMREVHRRLPRWNYKDAELALWQLDQRINDRGFAVDLDLASAAVAAVIAEQKRLSERACDLTHGYVESATQRDAMLAHLVAAYGVSLPDMQAATLERRIADPELPPELRELLAVRLQATTSSTAKYKKLLAATDHDHRLKGALQFCGAARTGRWSGRLFQPQNLPRPSQNAETVEFGIAALKAGCADLVADNVMQLASDALRGCIVAPQGAKLVASDLSNIEGRAAAWITGEKWKLKAFADFDAGSGPDLYVASYARSFNVSPDSVRKSERQVGKVQELSMAYEGGVGAFVTFAAAYGVDLSKLADTADLALWAREEAENAYDWTVKQKRPTFGLPRRVWVCCDALKRMWRAAHPNTTQFWPLLAMAVREAIETPDKLVHCGPFMLKRVGAWLRVGLPSGRALCYPQPRVADDGQISYMGINQYSRKWERVKTYGGKLFENACQALARDVMAANMPRIEAAGYEIVLTVHDEVICEAPDSDEFNAEQLSALLATVPEWAHGLPLAAGGFEAYRYRKE